MDSFSGSYPLEFISFCLDMSSEEQNDIVPATATAPMTEEEVAIPEEAGTSQATSIPVDPESTQLVPSGDNLDKPAPTPSPSTDESIPAYIDRQLQTLGCQGLGLDISFLPPTTSAIVDNVPKSIVEKTSESEPIPQVTTGSQDKESPEAEIERGMMLSVKLDFPSPRRITSKRIPATLKNYLIVQVLRPSRNLLS